MPTPALQLLAAPRSGTDPQPLPATLLRPGSRGAGADSRDELLANVVPTQSWTLDATARGDKGERVELAPDTRLLALEATDGTTLFIRADALAEQLDRLARSRPELRGPDGSVDLTALRPRDANNRGVGDWIWHKLTALVLTEDKITGMARDKLAELTGARVEDLVVAGATHAGAKAIVWAIEEHRHHAPGLYAWRDGVLDAGRRLDADAPELQALATRRGLVFIHGTGSHTLGAFRDLPGSQSWTALLEQFDGGLFGFEHHSFSTSPIDNALELVQALPAKARIALVTHSRGGLVGDLLCIDPNDSRLPEIIDEYVPPVRQRGDENPDPRRDADRAAFVAQEQAKLRELTGLLRDKALQVERYVRVASPAHGTALLGDNLDVFLSGLLGLTRRFGSWAAGAAVGASFGPAAASAARAATDKSIAVLTRIVLEIADRRLEPELLPGIEAMLPDAPMGRFLATAPSRPGLTMAVIAGDTAGDGLARRLGVMFTDWMLFDRADNDLVVDTASMYGGLASQAGARAIFVQGGNVNHFRYFRDDTAAPDGRPLPSALQRWLTAPDPLGSLAEWTTPAVPDTRDGVVAPPALALARGADPASAPLLVFLPGIMGSKLDADDHRVWLAPLALARGRLARLAMDAGSTVTEAGLIGMAYGELVEYLGKSHRTTLFAYDWRQPLGNLGERLAATLRQLLADNPQAPLRILAHSMGGLVVRAAFAHDKTLWDDIVARDGSQLVMLGTPNHGAHLFVETLLGQSDTVRTLARLDLRHTMQQILDIVAGFPGAVHLLPAPGFLDTGNLAVRDYYAPQTWEALAAVNDDLWFGRHLGGRPAAALLDDARAFWQKVADTRWIAKAPGRIAYVFGHSENTPCGIIEQRDSDGRPVGIALRGTPDGDGSVTWASGNLPELPPDRKWLMPADHMGLTSTPRYFGEIETLLAGGTPRQLGGLPVSRGMGATAAVREYRAGPPPGYPSEAEATARLLGGRLRRRAPAARQRSLRVGVTAMDLRFVQIPVLCGHYRGDPIAGAEGVIDRHLVDGALSQRQRLGIHSGELGIATIVLMPRTLEERRRSTGRGAVVVGLGEMGKLTADGVAETVRSGVLRFLLHAADRYGEEQPGNTAAAAGADPTLQLKLASLLIGSNSALQLDVSEAVKSVVLGVLMANRDFANGEPGTPGANSRRARVAELQFIEVFRDSAISAAYAVSQLDSALKSELQRLGQQLDTAEELAYGEGVRQRLSVSPFTDYWPRLVVSDADREETGCPPECYAPRVQTPIPPENLRQILRLYGCGDKVADGHLPLPTGLDEPPAIRYASRLKFIYMSDKARAESIVQLRQPGLVEKLCDGNFNGRSPTLYTPEAGFGNTLFQLLVPLDFKAAARQANNLILMVDDTSANLPWEMLEVDGRPMVMRTRLVRQFITARFRRQVGRTDNLSACVIANPSTEGFHAQFGGPGWQPRLGPDGQPEADTLADLPGAAAEGNTVTRVLTDAGYDVTPVPPDSLASDVFSRLFARSYRILMISAHGIHGRRAADGSYLSGVVLSDGLLLSAAEIGLMENVPDLVFLNCCHLGKIGPDAGAGSNRLAYSLARELIDMGVRCVVAAGWEVDDSAAQTFTETFFDQMANRNTSFGEALRVARVTTLDAHPACNTFGAYQAYGDPAFQLKVQGGVAPDDAPMRAPDELIDWIEQRRLDCRLPDPGRSNPSGRDAGLKALVRRVRTRVKCVPETWLDLPEVNQALGRLYAEYGSEGFDLARAALLRAIGEDSSRGMVPISAIEQLANLEARQAERISERRKPADLTAARHLADDAIARLKALIALSADQPDGRKSADAPPGNPERQAILGSAYKRKALVLARAGKPWEQAVKPLLELARDAYARSAGSPDDGPGWNPYNNLNQLQLDALLGAPVDIKERLELCQRAANGRFNRSFDFFDAVMSADAELARWLHTGVGSTAGLAAIYTDAMRGLTRSRRELDSVTSQMRILADLLQSRLESLDESARADEARRVETLLALVAILSGDTPPPAGDGCAPGSGTTEDDTHANGAAGPRSPD